MPDRFRLDGKVAVVTGGGRGIGRGIALALAECGADVCVVARRQADVDSVAAEIEARNRRSLACSADVMDFSAMPKVLDQVVEALGGLDIMVNNAGGNLDRKMHMLPDISLEKFDEQLALNMKTKFWGSQQAAARMRDGGRIINIISIAAHRPSPGFGVYSAAGTERDHRELHRPGRGRHGHADRDDEDLCLGCGAGNGQGDTARSHRNAGRLRGGGGVFCLPRSGVDYRAVSRCCGRAAHLSSLLIGIG
jgi:hypothetical protein